MVIRPDERAFLNIGPGAALAPGGDFMRNASIGFATLPGSRSAMALKSSGWSRRGAVLVLTCFFIVILLGMVAFAIDLGYIALTKQETQNAVDSGALAAASVMFSSKQEIRDEAKYYVNKHVAAGKKFAITDNDVEFGTWDATTRKFTASNDVGNAVRVTARRAQAPHFFGKVFGKKEFNVSASAIAMANKRDICFVVDLSGSMNDDSEPCWATDAINAEFGPQGYGSLGEDVVQQLYDDFGYGPFPGLMQHIGEPLLVAQTTAAYNNMTKNGGALSLATIPTAYRITSSDSSATRKSKCYKWIITNQIIPLMPAAVPTPNTTTNYGYWEKYLDYVIHATTTAPPSQGSYTMRSANNPNTAGYENADPNSTTGYVNKVGYRTYVQFMLDQGRDRKPDGVNYTPLSVRSPLCPMHSESTAGGTFSFPPREQPTHSTRRAMIAAMKVVKDKNANIADLNQRDWVSIVTFDAPNDGGPKVIHSLSGNYDAAMQACTTMQAVADAYYSTDTESGLQLARQHLKSTSQGGAGRSNATKVVVLLTDGAPNLYVSEDGDVTSFITDHDDDDFYSPPSMPHNAALMQTKEMQMAKYWVYAVGIGLGTDYGFMDRLARMGDTAGNDGQAPRGSGHPAEYENKTTEIFEKIISNLKERLVE
jgi:hypothetical protein